MGGRRRRYDGYRGWVRERRDSAGAQKEEEVWEVEEVVAVGLIKMREEGGGLIDVFGI